MFLAGIERTRTSMHGLSSGGVIQKAPKGDLFALFWSFPFAIDESSNAHRGLYSAQRWKPHEARQFAEGGINRIVYAVKTE